MIGFESKGSFKNTETFLNRMRQGDIFRHLDKYGRDGVEALKAATPVDTSETASSWYYEVGSKNGSYYISWNNSHSDGGSPVAILLQYGHGTGTGGYVAGRDYINPAMKPVFDKIASDMWKVVTSS